MMGGIEVSVFRVLSFGPMNIRIALSAVSVDGQCFINLLFLQLNHRELWSGRRESNPHPKF